MSNHRHRVPFMENYRDDCPLLPRGVVVVLVEVAAACAVAVGIAWLWFR